MTLLQFRTEVLKLCAQRGQPYKTSDADLTEMANETLREFTRRTLCLFSDRLTFVPVAGTASYRYDKPVTAFGNVAIIEIQWVYLTQNGTLGPLTDFDGRPGAVLLSDLQDRFPDYISAANGPVQRFYNIAPKTITLWPAPATVTGSHYVSGFYYHPTLSADGDELVLSPEDERAAAQYMAFLLVLPNAIGDAQNAIQTNLQLARDEMDTRATEVRRQLQVSTSRQSAGPMIVSLLD